MFESVIENYKNEIIENTCNLIKIPSVYEKTNNQQKPFGENCNKALEFMLNLGRKMGFKTKNIDGYCGYIECGEGEELIGIIGHLDVVPAGEGWKYEPFSATISNDRIYGRGAIDDKGPVISSLYAMKAVTNSTKLNKRVRLILGLNEENDWKCINYYKQHEELPSISFSPDADFPCIYAEKGILTIYLKEEYAKYKDNAIVIKTIDCNNNAINVVPKLCTVVLKVDSNKIQNNKFINDIREIIKEKNYKIEVEQIYSDEIKLTSYGISAHAAHPDLGVNAISRLIDVLYKIFNKYNINIEIFEFFEKFVGIQYNGENLKIDYEDESGILTLNVGTLDFNEDNIQIGMNIRVPVNTKILDIENKFIEVVNQFNNIKCEVRGKKEPLYIPKDNYLVTTLNNIFNRVTNMNEKPIAIGGATYARAFENCISFGANLPNQQDMCHQVDEFITIDNLIIASKVYAQAIYELGTK